MNPYRFLKWFALNLVLASLSGCAAFGIDGPMLNSRTIDATERMLLVTDKGSVRNDEGNIISSNSRVVCAEPSPDALIAAAATGNLALSPEGQDALKIGGSYAEAVGELGERTAVIQMLRDSLYRGCEANMNGLLTAEDYKQQVLVYFDDFALTLLAIESLTRQPRASTIVQTNAELNDKSKDDKPDQTSKGNSPPLPTPPVDNTRKEIAETVNKIIKNYGEHQLMFSIYQQYLKADSESKRDLMNLLTALMKKRGLID